MAKPTRNKGMTEMPSGLAESESKNNPPSTESSVIVGNPALSAAYTTSAGSKSICAPRRKRKPLKADSQKTARNATSRIRMEFKVLIADSKETSNIEHRTLNAE